MCTLHKNQYTFLNLSHSFLIMKSCRENEDTHFMFSNFFFSCAFNEIMWKNIVEPGMPQMTMVHACCMLDTKGYSNKLRICNTYCFCSGTVFE